MQACVEREDYRVYSRTRDVPFAQMLVEQLRKQQAQLVAVPKLPETIPVPAPADHTPAGAQGEEIEREEPKKKEEAEAPEIPKDESAEAAVDFAPEASQESRQRQQSIAKNAEQVIENASFFHYFVLDGTK